MPSDVVPVFNGGSSGLVGGRADRVLERGVRELGRQTTLRLYRTQAEGMVQAQKMHEIDQVAREAMTGQAMLGQYAASLAQGDPLVADDMQHFVNLARMGKGELLADLVTTYCREGMR